jgi:methionyl-tRNA formyltransferase
MTWSSSVLPRVRAVFFGSPQFAVPSLECVAATTEVCAVVTQPDRPAGRGQTMSEPAVKEAARRLVPDATILQPTKIRSGDFETTLRELQADLFVVVAYGRILPQSILDLPRRGPWNVHASVLPQLRGAAPIQWAIINGDSRAGVSIMRMEAGLDTGPVADVVTTDIRDGDTAASLSARLSVLGADLLATTIPRILDGSVVVVPQDDASATLAPILKKEDGRLDFTQPARLVSARARGVDPWPGATALLGAEHVKLFGPRTIAAAEEESDSVTAPGTVVRIDGGGLHVACGGGTRIVFGDLQLPGRKRLSAAAAAAGRAIAPGDRLA